MASTPNLRLVPASRESLDEGDKELPPTPL